MSEKTLGPPLLSCSDCSRPMQLRAYLPPTGSLPGVAGYWCDDCNKELTIETDEQSSG